LKSARDSAASQWLATDLGSRLQGIEVLCDQLGLLLGVERDADGLSLSLLGLEGGGVEHFPRADGSSGGISHC